MNIAPIRMSMNRKNYPGNKNNISFKGTGTLYVKLKEMSEVDSMKVFKQIENLLKTATENVSEKIKDFTDNLERVVIKEGTDEFNEDPLQNAKKFIMTGGTLDKSITAKDVTITGGTFNDNIYAKNAKITGGNFKGGIMADNFIEMKGIKYPFSGGISSDGDFKATDCTLYSPVSVRGNAILKNVENKNSLEVENTLIAEDSTINHGTKVGGRAYMIGGEVNSMLLRGNLFANDTKILNATIKDNIRLTGNTRLVCGEVGGEIVNHSPEKAVIGEQVKINKYRENFWNSFFPIPPKDFWKKLFPIPPKESFK